MMLYEKHLDKIVEFSNTYHKLINCHLVDFIVQDLWNECLHDTLKSELEDMLMEDTTNLTFPLEQTTFSELNSMVQSAKSLSLDSQTTIDSLQEFSEKFFDSNVFESTACLNSSNEFMKTKKFYEVELLGNLVSTIARSINGLVIDAGAGKAYLSTYLASNYNIPVLAIDSSNLCQKGAINRQRKMAKKNQSSSLVSYVLEEIQDETDYREMVRNHFSDWNLKDNLIITGLHTCGSLANSIIRSFVNTEDIRFLCIVPCCYHLADDTLEKKYTLSKNAKMLAQQSLERSTIKKSISPLLFYRAVLQVVLYSIGLYDARIGRGGPVDNFASYARWALLKLGIENEKVPAENDLERLYSSHLHWKKKFDMFQILRIHMAPVLEAAIVLDKMTFLKNNPHCSRIALLRLFDPVLSPRRYAILAMK